MDINSFHDYADRISFKTFNQIQSEYYGRNRLLTKEGVDLDHFKCEEDYFFLMLSGKMF